MKTKQTKTRYLKVLSWGQRLTVTISRGGSFNSDAGDVWGPFSHGAAPLSEVAINSHIL